MQGERGGLGFAEDISKVVVFLGHTRKIGGIDRERGRCRVELCILSTNVCIVSGSLQACTNAAAPISEM